jgi:hypothetical protein
MEKSGEEGKELKATAAVARKKAQMSPSFSKMSR